MRNIDKLFFGIVLFAIVLCVILIIFIRSEDSKCVRNPYLYGASKMGDVVCSCTQHPNSACPPTFEFNDTSFVTTPNICSGNRTIYKELDVSSFNFTLTP